MAHRTVLSTLRMLAFGGLSLAASLAFGQAPRQFSFAYDQPPTTAYGIAGTIFDAKLKELSGGKMSINQFPGGQLGQEPQMLQKLRAGDIDFVVTSTVEALAVEVTTKSMSPACSRCTSSSVTSSTSPRCWPTRASRPPSRRW